MLLAVSGVLLFKRCKILFAPPDFEKKFYRLVHIDGLDYL